MLNCYFFIADLASKSHDQDFKHNLFFIAGRIALSDLLELIYLVSNSWWKRRPAMKSEPVLTEILITN